MITRYLHVLWAKPLTPKQRWKQAYRAARLELQGKPAGIMFA